MRFSENGDHPVVSGALDATRIAFVKKLLPHLLYDWNPHYCILTNYPVVLFQVQACEGEWITVEKKKEVAMLKRNPKSFASLNQINEACDWWTQRSINYITPKILISSIEYTYKQRKWDENMNDSVIR